MREEAGSAAERARVAAAEVQRDTSDALGSVPAGSTGSAVDEVSRQAGKMAGQVRLVLERRMRRFSVWWFGGGGGGGGGGM